MSAAAAQSLAEVIMSSVVKAADIRKLEKLFGVPAKPMGSNYRFEIAMNDPARKLALEIYPNTRIGSARGDLISVYTVNAHLQLHFCSGYVISDVLGEVTFVGERDGRLSGLIIEKQGGCSLFANVDRSLVSAIEHPSVLAGGRFAPAAVERIRALAGVGS